MRDALLTGGVIAAGAIAALIALDHGAPLSSHFSSVVSAPDRSDAPAAGMKTSRAAIDARGDALAVAKPQQIGLAPSSAKKKSSGPTLVVMVPDLPPRQSPVAPNSGMWIEQGSGGPVTGPNPQGSGPIAMGVVGGVSAPLTSPTGQSQASFPAAPKAPVVASSSAHTASPHPATQSADTATHAGFVLLAGGQGDGQLALSSAELFDPAKNAFVPASSMKDARTDHTATVLLSGKILVAGGDGPSGRALSSAELYDPGSGKFSVVASKMDTARAEHTATLISGCNCAADGQVLIAGGTTATGSLGTTLRSAELYDPATGVFTATGAMKATRAGHTATLIVSGPLAGNVLIAGGTSDESGGEVATAELYDPVAGEFTLTGRMSTPRKGHSATWLSPTVVTGTLAGNVLVAGGGDVSAPNDSAEVFNPQTAGFSPVGAMTTPRTLQSAVLLDSGKVLIAGGQSSDSDFLLSAELFDPAQATFAATGSMHNVHAGATATMLNSGSALIAGGRSSFADLYDPTAGTFSATGSMVTDVAESTSTLINK